MIDGHDVLGRLFVSGNGKERPVMVGNRIAGLGGAPAGTVSRGEMLLDERFDAGPVEIAHGDDGHQVGAVPGPIEPLQGFGGEALDDLLLADGHALGVPRAAEENGELPVAHARVRALAQAPLLDDDAPFLVNGRGVEGHAVGPVFEDEEGGLEDLWRVRGNLEHRRSSRRSR